MGRRAAAAAALLPFVAVRAPAQTTQLPLSFVENRGQWANDARFVARGHGFVARFERTAIALELTDECGRGLLARLEFEGAGDATDVTGAQPQAGRHHYFIGSDPAAWRTDVPAFSELRYRGVQPGIDVRVHEHARQLEYDVELAPGADLAAFVVRCEGVDDVAVAEDGALVLATELGPIRSPPPTTWQQGADGVRSAVPCRFRRIDAHRFGFAAAARDAACALVIDPVLDWSTLIGGGIDDNLFAVAVEPSGVVDACGTSGSLDFPTTAGAYSTSRTGANDAVVVRLDPTQTGSAELLWSTYFGGSGSENARSITVDANGIVTVAGDTTSKNLPTTAGAFSGALGGTSDAFIARFDPSQSGTAQLLWSTYFGGSADDSAQIGFNGVDAAGVVTIAGVTASSDLPTTTGAFATTFAGGATDHFVARLDPSQSGAAQLLYSTYLGGTGDESNDAPSMEVDAAGDVVVGGGTASSDFPTTSGAFETTANGGSDGYVARLTLKSQGTADLLAATYLGGTRDDAILSLRRDGGGAIVVTGSTVSHDFPTTSGAYDTTANGALGGTDAFVVRLDPGLGTSALLYGSYLGGGIGVDRGSSVAVATTGEVIIEGFTTSLDFPTTLNCFQAGMHGTSDSFVVKMRLAGQGKNDLLYSTYFGGAGSETPAQNRGVALDARDFPVFVGQSGSSDFPTTTGAFQTTLSGISDGYLSRLSLASWQVYGTGWPGTKGIPTLTSRDDPVLGSTLTLDLSDARGRPTNALVMIGTSDANLVTSADGTLLVTPTTLIPMQLTAKNTALTGSLPNDDSLCGTSLYLQAIELDSGASQGLSFTAGLRLILGR